MRIVIFPHLEVNPRILEVRIPTEMKWNEIHLEWKFGFQCRFQITYCLGFVVLFSRKKNGEEAKEGTNQLIVRLTSFLATFADDFSTKKAPLRRTCLERMALEEVAVISGKDFR